MCSCHEKVMRIPGSWASQVWSIARTDNETERIGPEKWTSGGVRRYEWAFFLSKISEREEEKRRRFKRLTNSGWLFNGIILRFRRITKRNKLRGVILLRSFRIEMNETDTTRKMNTVWARVRGQGEREIINANKMHQIPVVERWIMHDTILRLSSKRQKYGIESDATM